MALNPLTEYELGQVQRIAQWKGQRPGTVTRAFQTIKRPADWLMARAVTGERMTRLLERLNDSADWSIPLNLIKREAGVEDIRALRSGSLDRCDELESHVKRVGMMEITTESLLCGAGGLVTELASIPVELMLMLRTVYRVARCYGYDLDSKRHKTVVLAVIGVSMLKQPEDRQRWTERIWEMMHRAETDADLAEEERLLEEEFREEVIEEVMQGVAIELLENKVEESVPVIGELVSVALDTTFTSKVERAARAIFQEMWLRHNHKVDRIDPVITTTDLIASAGETLSRAAYGVAFGVGFGVTLPSIFLARVGSSVLPKPVLDGFLDGGIDAEERVVRVLANGTAGGDATADAAVV